ncbi:alpha/beta hydrolase [Pseudomonas oryzihabitans]|uniref:alpha/beta hydrolase n=1 Tax=Pseudomonas oryzihabitans TaxID=47885 RepID=UPI00197D8274|nr:alpha/beta hydrolase-fold protein [Pseudomonas psychrotolerans]
MKKSCSLVLAGALMLGVGWVAPTLAQEPRKGTLVERGSMYYSFETHLLNSVDGKRRYRVYIGIPKQPAPMMGYPALFLLDGDAALAQLQDVWLSPHKLKNPPALVAIGYADAADAMQERTYDFTPAIGGGRNRDDVRKDWPAGGSSAFLDLIEQRIKPLLTQSVPVDPNRQTLWGHGYGGLFVLDTLYRQPQAFQRYVASDVAYGWQQGHILKRAEQFQGVGGARPVQLWLFSGSEDLTRKVAPDAPKRLAERLAGLPGLQVTSQVRPNLGPEAILSISLPVALEVASDGVAAPRL